MARVQEDPRPLKIETDNIIDEYRVRISQALEKEKQKLIEQAERESQDILARAQQEAGQIIAQAKAAASEETAHLRQEAQQAAIEVREKANTEAENLVAQAKQKAENLTQQAQQKAESLVKEAGKKAEEEAKEKTKKQVEKIIAAGKEEADKFLATARATAKKEADDLLAASKAEAEETLAGAKQEAAQLIDQTREKTLKEAKKEALRVITAAEAKAGQLTTSAIALGIKQGQEEMDMVLMETQDKLIKEMSQSLVEISKRVSTIIGDVRSAVQDRVKENGNDIPAALAELTRNNIAAEEPKTDGSPASQTETTAPVEEAQTVAGENTESPAEDESPVETMSDDKLYEGVFNLEIKPPVEFSQLMMLRRYLSRIPDLKLVSSAGFVSDGDGAKTVYVIELKRPCALIKILEDLPGIESISQQKRDILIKLA